MRTPTYEIARSARLKRKADMTSGRTRRKIATWLPAARVQAAIPSLEKVPAQYRGELEAMEDLGEKALWRISRARLAPAKQRRVERLLDKNRRGELTDQERRSLKELRTDGDRMMLQRSYAVLLLKYR
jgi:hypothetical protein